MTFGLIGIIGIFENIILAKKTAALVGWPHSPYQIKYGFCQLCLGYIGVMTFWVKGTFWIAALVTMYMYGLSGFWTHTAEMIKNKKIDRSNMSNLIMNLCYQLFITALSIATEEIW